MIEQFLNGVVKGKEGTVNMEKLLGSIESQLKGMKFNQEGVAGAMNEENFINKIIQQQENAKKYEKIFMKETTIEEFDKVASQQLTTEVTSL